MKTISSKQLKNGKFRTIVETDADECIQAVRNDSHYKLGYPMDDQIVASHILQGLDEVSWCSYSQKWVN